MGGIRSTCSKKDLSPKSQGIIVDEKLLSAGFECSAVDPCAMHGAYVLDPELLSRSLVGLG